MSAQNVEKDASTQSELAEAPTPVLASTSESETEFE